MSPITPNQPDPERPGMRKSLELSSGEPEKPIDVPVYSCIVYVGTPAGGGVVARVANLGGITCTAGTEREALGQVVKEFKRRLMELAQRDQAIPWIDPPSPSEPGEQQRFIPVHL